MLKYRFLDLDAHVDNVVENGEIGFGPEELQALAVHLRPAVELRDQDARQPDIMASCPRFQHAALYFAQAVDAESINL